VKFKVLTLNVYGLSNLFVKNPDRKLRLKKLSQVFKSKLHPHHRKWDILLLQELWHKKDRNNFKKSNLYPYDVDIHYRNPARKENIFDSGLLILSRFKILEKHRFNLSNKAKGKSLFNFGERFVRKAVYLAKIKLPSKKKIWVANTHLASNYFPHGPDNKKLRKVQLKQIFHWLKRKVKKDPIIMGGDFNFGPSHQGYDGLWDELPTLLPGMMHDHHTKEISTFSEKNLLNIEGESGKLDHLFSSEHFKIINAGRALNEQIKLPNGKITNYSDHYGFESRYELKVKNKLNLI